MPRAAGDPWVTDNADGTSTAVWNFSNPADYTLTNASVTGGAGLLASSGPGVQFWNSTTAGDFAGPDSATNVDFAGSPGDVMLASTSGPSTLLVLQPDGATGQDSWLEEFNPTATHGSETIMSLDGTGSERRPILRFDISSIPANAVIDGAVLYLYQNADNAGDTVVASVYQVTASWTEADVTWDDRDASNTWLTAGGDFDSHVIAQATIDATTNVWRSWNITQLADWWYRGVRPNYGLILDCTAAASQVNKEFRTSDYVTVPAQRPRLEIQYRVLGASGEYVSKVLGPGTPTAWQTISWNASVRSLVADEFNGASLNPKWTWLNAPVSSDVGTTVPGHLHVVSTANSQIEGATFTGNALWDVVVGDFSAEMKFSSSPTSSSNRVGLMALLSQRDWFSVGKHYSGGAVNWMTRETVDAVTTTVFNGASGNPIPGWVRLVRTGNTFEAWTSSDGIAWTLRDTYIPSDQYPLAIRLAFYIAHGAAGSGFSADVDYIRVTHGAGAAVSVSTRTGDTNPVDVSWSGWSAPYPLSSGSAMAGTSNFVEYRLSFAVSIASPDHRPVVGDVNITSGTPSYVASGTIETNDLVPADLQQWGTLTVADARNGQTVSYEYSLNSGGSWTPVVPPADLSGVSVASGRIRFRVSLSTSDSQITPTVSEIRLTYTHRLDHFFVTASAAAAAGAPFSVTVTAKDATNATILSWTGTVTLAARLLDGITPGNGVLGTTSLAISAGGTATLATENYTRAETIRIHASFGAQEGLSGPVLISPGPIVRVVVAPPSVTLLPFASQSFTATAFDAWDNPVPGAAFTWVVTNGVGTLNTSSGPTVTMTAQPPVGANGTVEATASGVTGVALVTVGTPTPPWVAITAPIAGASITGVASIGYTNSPDTTLLTFDYDAGAGWIALGNTSSPTGSFPWDTTGVDAVGVVLRVQAENAALMTNQTSVTPIEIDNTPPTIALGTITDNQATSGTIAVAYATVADVVRVDFTYFDGTWQTIGTDVTVDGSYVWTPGTPINGVTLRAVAVDEVDLAGADQAIGVGTRVIGTNPPAIAPIPDVRVRTGMAYDLNLTFYVSDPDTPLGGLSISTSDAANVTAFGGSYPSLRVTYAVVGTYDVTLWVSDGTDTAWRIVRVIASSANPPALVSPLGTSSFDEDSVLTDAVGALSTRFSDADNETLSFTILDAASIGWRINGDLTLDFWAPQDWYGSEVLRVRATDPSGGFAEAPLLVVVRPVNDAPVLAAIARLQWTAGESLDLDLMPYVSDIDTPIAQIVATTDSPHVRVNGLVLTMTFPSTWTEARFTVNVSDGGAQASQLVLVTLLPPPSIIPYLLPIPPVALAVVIGVFARRARWRPVKAFLMDEKNELLREFTMDPGCQVTWDQVQGSGALDAVEKPVRVSKYHAQTVKGDALGVVLLAYGPVTKDQIEFARELLVNVQDRFEDRLKNRIDENRGYESEILSLRADVENRQKALDARAHAFAGMFDAWTVGQAKMAVESSRIRATVENVENREASLGEGVASLEEARSALEEERRELTGHVERLKGDMDLRNKQLEGRGQTVRASEGKLKEDREKFEATRKEKMEWIASKDLELDAKIGGFAQREAAVKSQAEENARMLADLAAREESLEIETDRIEKLSQESKVRNAQAEESTRQLEVRAATMRDQEAHKVDEFKNWQGKLESREAVLREQKKSFEEQMTNLYQTAIAKQEALSGREGALGELEARIRAESDSVKRTIDEVGSREQAAQDALRESRRLREEIESIREAMVRRATELDAREGAIKSEARGIEAEMARRKESMQAMDKDLADRRAEVETAERFLNRQMAEIHEAARKAAARETELGVAEREVKARQATVDDRLRFLSVAEQEVAARRKAIDEDAEQIAQARVDSEARRKEFEARVESSGTLFRELSARERDVAARESSEKARETALQSREAESLRRDVTLKEKEARFEQTISGLDRRDAELVTRAAKLDEEVKAAANLRQQAETEREATDKVKLAADAQQAEVTRTMKFLQKKAVDILDREEQIRKREKKLEETERILDSQVEIVETQRNAIEVERSESGARIERLQADVERTRAKLLEAEKRTGGPALNAEMEKDIENRLKIIQQKAFALLDREEQLREREEEVAEREKLIARR